MKEAFIKYELKSLWQILFMAGKKGKGPSKVITCHEEKDIFTRLKNNFVIK